MQVPWARLLSQRYIAFNDRLQTALQISFVNILVFLCVSFYHRGLGEIASVFLRCSFKMSCPRSVIEAGVVGPVHTQVPWFPNPSQWDLEE